MEEFFMKWKLTTLIENHMDKEESYVCEHGLSVLIESVNQEPPVRLLMDTGQSGTFYDNAAKMGISLEDLSALLISHAHYDHAGGVKRLIEEEKVRKMYVGKDFFREKYYEKKDGTMKNIGIAFSREELEKKGVSVCEVKEDMQMIFSGVTLHRNFERAIEYEPLNPHFFIKKEENAEEDFVDKSVSQDKTVAVARYADRIQAKSPANCNEHLTESIFQTHSNFSDEELSQFAIEEKFSIYTKDSFTDEIAVALDTEKGLVVIVGCSHPGIMNILKTIEKRSGKKICGVVGGTHLMEADEERLRKTIVDLKKMNINFIAVSHCTGEDNLEMIKENFGEKFIFNCTGNVIRF